MAIDVVSGVLFALGRGEPMAEHRVYGASIGAFLAAGSAFGMLAHRFDRRGPMWRRLLAIALRPRGEFGYMKLAGCLIGSGRLREAAAAFEQLGAVSPLSPRASTGLGLVAILRSDLAEGRAHFQRSVERNPPDPLGHLLLAFADGSIDPESTSALCQDLEGLAPTTAPSDTCMPGKRSDAPTQDR